MKKNIIIYMVLVLTFVFMLTGCSAKSETSVKQSAAAKQLINENQEETSYYEKKNDLEGDYKKLKDGTHSYKTEDSAEYFFASNDDLYLKVVVQKDYLSEADSIYNLFSAKADE